MTPPGTVLEMPPARKRNPGKPTLPPEEARRVHEGVRQLLKNFDDNRTALAKAVKVSQPTVTAWAQGDSVPMGINLERIARLLGKSEYELRTGIAAIATGAPGALDVALLYWPGRWPPEVIARARALAERGESHSPQGWTIRLDELRG